jgi:hypothetical protein
MVADLERRIVGAAQRLADLAVAAGNPALAGWAAERGLHGGGHPDNELLVHRLRAAAAGGNGPLMQAWREVTARLAAVDDAPSPDLVAFFDQLRVNPRPVA